VSKRMLLIGLLVVGVAMLSGCALLDQILGGSTGGGTPGGGTTTSAYPVSGKMKCSLAATVSRDDGYTGAHTYAGNVATTFWSGAGKYNENISLFCSYDWEGGDFSDTWFCASFSADEKAIISFDGMQTQANIWGGYTKMHHISGDGANIPFVRVDGNSRYYRIDGPDARHQVQELLFMMWAPGAEKGASQADPLEWIPVGPAALTALTGGSGDYIEIRLDYENAAVAPQ